VAANLLKGETCADLACRFRIGTRSLVFRSFPGAALVRGARGHADEEWFVDLGA